MRIVDIMLNVIQPLRNQSWYHLLSPQKNLRPWLQVQDAEVGLRARDRAGPRKFLFSTFKTSLSNVRFMRSEPCSHPEAILNFWDVVFVGHGPAATLTFVDLLAFN